MRLKHIIISILMPILAYHGLLLINSSYLRQSYVSSVKQIPIIAEQKLKQGHDLESVTQWAVDKRNQLKHDTREKGSYIDKKWAEDRNIQKYNNPLGPSYAWLFNKIQSSSQESAEAVNKKIIAGSGKTNLEINESIKQKGWLGIAYSILVIGLLGYRIYSSDALPKRNIVIPELGRIIGGLAGGSLGVHLGVNIAEALAYPELLATFGFISGLIGSVVLAYFIAFLLVKFLYHAPKTFKPNPPIIPKKESAMVE